MLPEHKQKTTGATMNWAMHINNSTLPLLYLDTCNIRIILPASELTAVGDLHDVSLLQVEAISLTPQVSSLQKNELEMYIVIQNCRFQGEGWGGGDEKRYVILVRKCEGDEITCKA
jgi:hypothetical protein